MDALRTYFQRELPGINAFLDTETAKLSGLVRDVARHAILGGGKRIRPVLTLLCARVLGREPGGELPLACALEMLHSATLLHDDVLDGANLRRGKTSAHIRFGVTETILAGDALLALSNKLGAEYGQTRISWLLAEGTMATADGEVLEIQALADPGMDRNLYMNIIIGKTARLIETSCRCGAALAGAEPAVEDICGDYGLNLGIAFQLVDDALDYAQQAKVLGKPEGGDLKEGKVTLPLIFLLESLTESEANALLARLHTREMSETERAEVVARVRDGGFAEATRAAAAHYIAKAKAALARLPERPERTVLSEAADFVLVRNK